MDKLPIEILEIVGSNLNIAEYHSLRLATKRTTGMTQIPTLSFESYKESCSLYDLPPDNKFLLDVTTATATALKYCKSKRQERTALLLLKRRPELILECDAIDFICFAAHFGHVEILELLLKNKRLQVAVSEGDPLWEACHNNHFDVVKMLLADGRFDPNDAIRTTCDHGYANILKELLRDPRITPNCMDDYPIRAAAANGHLDCVKLLLKDGRADPTSFESYPLRGASYSGHYEVVRLLLLDGRVNPHADNNYALRSATGQGNHQMIRLLDSLSL